MSARRPHDAHEKAQPEAGLAEALRVAREAPADVEQLAEQLARVHAAVLRRAAEGAVPDAMLTPLSAPPAASKTLPLGAIVLALMLAGLGALLGSRFFVRDARDADSSSASTPVSAAQVSAPAVGAGARTQDLDVGSQRTSEPSSQAPSEADEPVQPSAQRKAARGDEPRRLGSQEAQDTRRERARGHAGGGHFARGRACALGARAKGPRGAPQ